MASVWSCIGKQFGKEITIKLQAEDVNNSTAVEIYDSLIIFLTELQTSFPIHKNTAEKNNLLR